MAENSVKQRVAAILAADAVEYTRLMADDETATIDALDAARAVFAKHVGDNRGRIVDTAGDSVLAVFDATEGAARASIAIQNRLEELNTPVPEMRRMRFRIGLHLGDIREKADGTIYGDGVNIAARLEGLADPGGIVVSDSVQAALRGHLDINFVDDGAYEVKNVAEPVHVYRILSDDALTASSLIPDAGPSDKPSIAVEPFAYAPDNQESRAAAEDLRENLLERLARRSGISVIDDLSRQAKNPTYQLRGRLRLSPTRGRLQLSMTQPGGGAAVWSQTYEGDPSDIFAFCDDIVDRADSHLRVQINAFDGNRMRDLQEDQMSVSELRSRAATLFYQVEIESWEQARDLMDRALRLDPADPMALAMRAESVIHLAAAKYEELEPEEVARLENGLNAAIEASPRTDYFFWARGLFRTQVVRAPELAIEDLQRALSLSPAYTPAFECLGLAYLSIGQFGTADKNLEKAVTLSESDPLWTQRVFAQAVAQLCDNRPDEAEKTITKAIQLRPTQRAFLVLKAECCRRTGNMDQASEIDVLVDELPRHPITILAPRPPVPPEYRWVEELLAPDTIDTKP